MLAPRNREFKMTFVHTLGNMIYIQEGASRVNVECNWSVEAYGPRELFVGEIKEGTMTTEHPMFLKMMVEIFGRKISFDAPKWILFTGFTKIYFKIAQQNLTRLIRQISEVLMYIFLYYPCLHL